MRGTADAHHDAAGGSWMDEQSIRVVFATGPVVGCVLLQPLVDWSEVGSLRITHVQRRTEAIEVTAHRFCFVVGVDGFHSMESSVVEKCQSPVVTVLIGVDGNELLLIQGEYEGDSFGVSGSCSRQVRTLVKTVDEADGWQFFQW